MYAMLFTTPRGHILLDNATRCESYERAKKLQLLLMEYASMGTAYIIVPIPQYEERS